MKVELQFTEPILGTVSGNKAITEEFIASKNPEGLDQAEIDAIEENELEKSSTVFPRMEDGRPMLWDYQVKGFLKSACLAMIGMDCFTKEELKKVRLTQYLYKRTIDLQIFIKPRKIPLILPPDGVLGSCERPLRAETMRGERIALARSEEAPAGTAIQIEIISLNKKLYPYIEKWLDYGQFSGIGQWRNSGKGRFEWAHLVIDTPRKGVE